MSGIVKVKKYDCPFVQIDKSAINDKRLSWKARGLLAYLLSKPDDWKIWINDLVKRSDKDGITSVRTGLKELINAGYMTFDRGRDNGGQFAESCYTVYERPLVQPQVDFPHTVNPHAEKPYAENLKHTNNNTTNTEDTNNNNTNVIVIASFSPTQKETDALLVGMEIVDNAVRVELVIEYEHAHIIAAKKKYYVKWGAGGVINALRQGWDCTIKEPEPDPTRMGRPPKVQAIRR